MAHYLGLREHHLELDEQAAHGIILCTGQRVHRATLIVQSALIADADGAAVVWAGMGSHLQQLAKLHLGAVLAEVEVIAACAHAASLVVADELLGGVVAASLGGTTVDHQEPYTLGRVHHLAALIIVE